MIYAIIQSVLIYAVLTGRCTGALLLLLTTPDLPVAWPFTAVPAAATAAAFLFLSAAAEFVTGVVFVLTPPPPPPVPPTVDGAALLFYKST